MTIITIKILLDQSVDRQTLFTLEFADQMAIDVTLVGVLVRRNGIQDFADLFDFLVRIILQKIMQQFAVIAFFLFRDILVSVPGGRILRFLSWNRFFLGRGLFLLDDDPGLGILVLLDDRCCFLTGCPSGPDIAGFIRTAEILSQAI